MPIRFINKKGVVTETGYCMRDLNILSHAQLVELEIGSQCGGHGICGKDKVRCASKNASSDFSEFTPAELELLSEKEREKGWRLACQIFPQRNDISATFETKTS